MTRRVNTPIRLGIHSVSPSDQSPRSPREETLGTYREISRSFSAKSRGVTLRNVAEFLRELSRSFSSKFRGENPRRNKWFLFFSAKKKKKKKKKNRARGVPRRNAKKELFSWADLYKKWLTRVAFGASENAIGSLWLISVTPEVSAGKERKIGYMLSSCLKGCTKERKSPLKGWGHKNSVNWVTKIRHMPFQNGFIR